MNRRSHRPHPFHLEIEAADRPAETTTALPLCLTLCFLCWLGLCLAAVVALFS